MALASAVLAIDESADDCILVLANLRKISLNLHRIFHIKENQWDKNLFYLNKEVCPDFFGSDRISTRASSIAPTDMFPSLFFLSLLTITPSSPLVRHICEWNDKWSLGNWWTSYTLYHLPWELMSAIGSLDLSSTVGATERGHRCFLWPVENLLETHLELFCL